MTRTQFGWEQDTPVKSGAGRLLHEQMQQPHGCTFIDIALVKRELGSSKETQNGDEIEKGLFAKILFANVLGHFGILQNVCAECFSLYVLTINI